MGKPERPSAMVGWTSSRLEFFSDGVLAIVITLLILGLADKCRGFAQYKSQEVLVDQLLGLWPHVLGYVLSFLLIAIYWFLHHMMFHFVRRVDRPLLWMNIFFLMSVAFLPFPTGLLAECIFHESNVILILYGCSHIVTSLSLLVLWRYATGGYRLISKDMDAAAIRSVTRWILVGPLLYGIGVGVSFVSVPAALFLYLITPLFYMLPGRIDDHWMSLAHHASTVPAEATADDVDLLDREPVRHSATTLPSQNL